MMKSEHIAKGCVHMSSTYTLKISAEEAKEMPMVDLAFNILKAANTPFYYRDLMDEIAKVKGISEEEVMDVVAHLYTEINIDGRFACVGTNLWGLKRWYPVDKADDVPGNTERPRIINDEEDEDEEEEEEDIYEVDSDEDFDEDDHDEEDEFDDEDADEADELIEEEIEDIDEVIDEDIEDIADDIDDEDADDSLLDDDELDL